jgi:hypothetical protein
MTGGRSHWGSSNATRTSRLTARALRAIASPLRPLAEVRSLRSLQRKCNSPVSRGANLRCNRTYASDIHPISLKVFSLSERACAGADLLAWNSWARREYAEENTIDDDLADRRTSTRARLKLEGE